MALSATSRLFYWSALYGPNAVGEGGDAVIARDTSGSIMDHVRTGRHIVRATPRIPNWTEINGILRPSLRLEMARMNMDPNSENFGAWSTSDGPTLTSGQADPFGGAAAYNLADTSAGVTQYIFQNIAGGVLTNGFHAQSIFVKRGLNSPDPTDGARIALLDVTAGTYRTFGRIKWSGGDPDFVASTGTYLGFERWRDGWFRVAIQSTDVIGANSHMLMIIPADNAIGYTGDIRIFGHQLELGKYPTSYFKTSGAAAVRATDQFYWKDCPLPQAMAIYTRMKIKQPGMVDQWLWQMGPNTNLGSRLLVYMTTTTDYQLFHNNGTISTTADLTISPGLNDVVELVSVLKSDGKVRLIGSKNGAAANETVDSSAAALGAAWSGTRQWLNSAGTEYYGANEYLDQRIVKLADLTNQPGTATPQAVMQEMRNYILGPNGEML